LLLPGASDDMERFSRPRTESASVLTLGLDEAFFFCSTFLVFSDPPSLPLRFLTSFRGWRLACAAVGVVAELAVSPTDPPSVERASLDPTLGVDCTWEGLLYEGLSRMASDGLEEEPFKMFV
jgi:hypothetical protein